MHKETKMWKLRACPLLPTCLKEFNPNYWISIKKKDEVVPGRSTVMASCTACLSRLSRANIQWGFTRCCFNTLFTYIQNSLFNVIITRSWHLNNHLENLCVDSKWNLLHLESWTALPAGCSLALRQQAEWLGGPAAHWSAASYLGSGCCLASNRWAWWCGLQWAMIPCRTFNRKRKRLKRLENEETVFFCCSHSGCN